MNSEQIEVLERCTRGAWTGTQSFPDILISLFQLGVERYHVDYTRKEITYYSSDGSSHVTAIPQLTPQIENEFSKAEVEAAVRQSQRNEHTFPDFVRKTMHAGCVGYFVQLSGRCVLYFGRRGECHIEHFPTAST